MIEWEKINLAQGRISLAEAATRFVALGATPEQRELDRRSADELALDVASTVAQAHEYVIHWQATGDTTPMSPQLTALDTSARGWMVAAGMPANVGNALVNQITKALQTTRGLTEAQLEQRGFAEMKRLEQVHGDKLGEWLDAVNRLVHAIEVTHPGCTGSSRHTASPTMRW